MGRGNKHARDPVLALRLRLARAGAGCAPRAYPRACPGLLVAAAGEGDVRAKQRTCKNGIHTIGFKSEPYEGGHLGWLVASDDEGALNPEYDDLFDFCPDCGIALDEFTLRKALSDTAFPVGITQGGGPARGRTPKGAAEGISMNAEPRDLDSKAVLPSCPKPSALRRRWEPEPSISRQSGADLPASAVPQAREHRT